MTKLEIETINHVGLVVRDAEAAERFYVGVLGLRRHHSRPSWLLLNDESALHLIHLPVAGADASPHAALRHVALQVPDLRAVLGLLLDRGVRVFQVDFDGSVRHLASPDDALDFGVGSLFVRDPDGNTIEFLELGRGLFASEGRAGSNPISRSTRPPSASERALRASPTGSGSTHPSGPAASLSDSSG